MEKPLACRQVHNNPPQYALDNSEFKASRLKRSMFLLPKSPIMQDAIIAAIAIAVATQIFTSHIELP